MVALMYSRLISALLALPIMAIVIAAIGGISADDIMKTVINGGVMKLHVAYATTIIGAILAELINKHGIAKALVRWVAEYSGDNPFLLGIFLVLITALLFSSLGGLGAVIMVGTVILPVMLSLGFDSKAAGALYLFGISLGGMFNLANWQLYMEVLRISQTEIIAYVLPFALGIFFIISIFLLIELKQLRNLKYIFIIALLIGFYYINEHNRLIVSGNVIAGNLPDNTLSHSSIFAFIIAFICLCIYALIRYIRKDNNLSGLAFLTPVVPLVLVLCCHWDIISAFIAGILYGVLVTWSRQSVNLLTRSIIEGAAAVVPAVVLMMGIGMLLMAVMHPNIANAMEPLIKYIVPTHAMSYVLVFTLVAPLALYRGPLSLWGMGSGIVVLIQKATTLSSQALMSMLMSVGQLQGICDPTNTHNVWIATYLGVDTLSLLKKTLIYTWVAVFFGLVLAIILGYVPR
jgi:hypothetical protein